MSWSGGKDSAMALHQLLQSRQYEVVGLLTTVNDAYRRISHHGVREALLEQQAEAIGLPLHRVRFCQPAGVDDDAAMRDFDAAMAALLAELRARGVFHVGFGDIFLENIRRYREQRMAAVGMRPVFPLWGCDTSALLRRFRADGFGAVVTCAEPVAADLCGAELADPGLDAGWPRGVDPCGEHGEFHSFVHRGPIFRRPVPFARGEQVVRDGRHYLDLLPVTEAAHEPENIA